MGDHLLSINQHSLIGVDVDTAESIIKALPRGVVHFVAMAPPRDVTGSGFNSGRQSSGLTPSRQSPLPSTLPPPPPASPVPEVIDEPGIVRVQVGTHHHTTERSIDSMTFLQLQRFGGTPLGLIIEGGSESPLKYIFIKSIAFGSPAFSSGQFMKGDQLVMVGSECLIGMSLFQAKRVLEQAPAVVEVVAQRKESVKQSPPLAPKSEVVKNKAENSGNTLLGHKPGRQEDTQEEVAERKRFLSEERELQLTESLPAPHRRKESSSQAPQFRRSTSQSDMWMMETSPGASTSLGYASTTNLSASLNIPRPGLQFQDSTWHP